MSEWVDMCARAFVFVHCKDVTLWFVISAVVYNSKPLIYVCARASGALSAIHDMQS